MFFNFKPIANLKNLHIAFLAMLCFFTVGCSSTGNHANNDIAGIFDDISDDNSDNNSDNNSDDNELLKTEDVPWVLLSFDISTEGVPVNVKVLDTNANGVFDKEALIALKKWKYRPKIVDGKPVVQKDLKVRLDFTLAE